MSLRAELLQIAADPSCEVIDRTIAVTSILAEALAALHVEPVLVGGMAVLFWTEAPEFTTHDIDLVMDEPPAAYEVIQALGFERALDGRHWQIPGTPVYIELPDRHLPDGARVEDIRLPNGRSTRVLSQVDVLIVRLEELMIGPRSDVARQALALFPGVDRERLAVRAEQVGVGGLAERFGVVADEVESGMRDIPGTDELYDLVKGV